VRGILSTIIEEEADVTLVDMEAGLEHLSRSGGTLAYANLLLVVMEPTRKSVVTAARTMTLAEELGIPQTYGLGNKARLPEDAEFFRALCEEYRVPLVGVIPYDTGVLEADRSGSSLGAGRGEAVRAEISRVIGVLDGVSVN
jgi:CO dehydrogenase maturation factor